MPQGPSVVAHAFKSQYSAEAEAGGSLFEFEPVFMVSSGTAKAT